MSTCGPSATGGMSTSAVSCRAEIPLVSCYPFLVRPELEFSGVIAQASGGAGELITRDIGGLLPIALCGLTSL